MASARQIEANRRNARRSTGPRTDAGKARARRNALRHGLTAVLLQPPPDGAHAQALVAALVGPAGSNLLRHLAQEIAIHEGRLRRCREAAAALWRAMATKGGGRDGGGEGCDHSGACDETFWDPDQVEASALERYGLLQRYARQAWRDRAESLQALVWHQVQAGAPEAACTNRLGPEPIWPPTQASTDRQSPPPAQEAAAEGSVWSPLPSPSVAETASGALAPIPPQPAGTQQTHVLADPAKRTQVVPPPRRGATGMARGARLSRPTAGPERAETQQGEPTKRSQSSAERVPAVLTDPVPRTQPTLHMDPPTWPVRVTKLAEQTQGRPGAGGEPDHEDQTKRSPSPVAAGQTGRVPAKRTQSPLRPMSAKATSGNHAGASPRPHGIGASATPDPLVVTSSGTAALSKGEGLGGSIAQNEARPREPLLWDRGRGTLDDPLIPMRPLIENRYDLLPQFRIGPPRR